jgi:integrase
MGTIKHRGEHQFQAIIRKKGYPNKSKTFETRALGKDWLEKTERSMDAGIFVDPAAGPTDLLDSILKRYLEEVVPTHKGHESEKYRINKMRRDSLARYRFTAVTSDLIAEYRNDRLKEVSPSSVRRDLELLRSIFNYAQQEWRIKVTNPVALIKLPGPSKARDRRISKDEETWIVRTLETTPRNTDGSFAEGTRNPWVQRALKLSIETAMRRSELFALDWKNIDLEQQTAFLPSGATKNGYSRTVPLSKAAVEILHTLDPKTEGAVFPTTNNAIKLAYARAVVRARKLYLSDCASTGKGPKPGFLEDLHWHDARHEAISRFVPKLANILELKAVSGHRDIRSLDRYYTPDSAELARKLG